MKWKYFILLFSLAICSIQAQSQEVEQDWTSFVQFIDVKFEQKTKFKISASVRVETDDDKAWAGLWARVDNKGSENGFFDNMADRPIKSANWQKYEIEGHLDAQSEQLNFGGLCVLNGSFYFDDFQVFLEKDDGSFEELSIQNPDFEVIDSNGIPVSWNAGISAQGVQVKGYSISTTPDSVNGQLALHIEGSGIQEDTSYLIGPRDGFSPQMGTLVSMLENLSKRVEQEVKNLSLHETDWLLDDNANSIGALVMHLAATEVYYQAYSFEDRTYNQAESEFWTPAMDLGDAGRETIKGKEISYYLNLWKEARKKTLEELQKRDDAWLQQERPGSGVNNFFYWFHVMEHQSSHLGQILMLKKRIPPETKIELPEKVKD